MARPNFEEKTFMDGPKTMKFVNVFSLESFPLYGIYSRRHKNGDVSIPCHSVKTETCARSIQQKTENERELSTATNGANNCVNCC